MGSKYIGNISNSCIEYISNALNKLSVKIIPFLNFGLISLTKIINIKPSA